jgi:serine/threonine-protein kinase
MLGNSHALRQDALICGQFRLRRPIGAGGMGAVWEAEHLRLGSPVAIKFLGQDYLRDDVLRARFLREAQSASRIRSPHVVQVLDHGTTENGIPYLVMELLEGEDLASRLRRAGACSLAETARILEQIGRALSRAHAAGLVHRDIKPHNVFLTLDGDRGPFVKLLDFGIAKDVSQAPRGLTLAGSVLGSAHYISPEQLHDPHSVGPATDIWALGVVAYEMLTGKVPFDAPYLPEVLMRVTEAKFAPASSLRRELPPEIDAWMRKAIEPDRALRFASVKEMTQAFVEIAASAPGGLEIAPLVPEPPLPAGEGTWPPAFVAEANDAPLGGSEPAKRRRGLHSRALIAGVLIALGTAGLAGLITHRQRQAVAEANERTASERAVRPAPAHREPPDITASGPRAEGRSAADTTSFLPRGRLTRLGNAEDVGPTPQRKREISHKAPVTAAADEESTPRSTIEEAELEPVATDEAGPSGSSKYRGF